MARKMNVEGLELLKRWEGLRLKAYRDAGGVWTIGYGHTSMAGKPLVYEGMAISEPQAEEILARDLRQYEKAVEENVKVALSDNQFAALVSFTYNVGIGAFRRSTLLKRLNAGDYDGVPIEMMKWTRAGKKRLKGLENRRAAEAGLWVKGAFVASRAVRPQPATQAQGVCRPETIAPVVGALSGLGGVLAGDGVVQYALAFIMVVACLIGAWWFVRRQRGQQEAWRGGTPTGKVEEI